ncbi:MAG TPA: kelch repeat-containing protein [Chitinophagales bacterium]|nr:kelch repeat-containing protein [Chitinophagales bacterium]
MKKITLLIFLPSILNLLSSPSAHAQAGQWTWIKGDSTNVAAGTFGTQGIPSPGNNPPGFYEPSEWKGKDGTFWLFGGFHSGVYNDVWRYNLQTNEWTWMNGDGVAGIQPIYGIKGSFAAANTPGNQQWCAASWVDTAGKFWLFGGSDGSGTHYNLLWQYDPSINEWAWMHGDTVQDSPGNYGTQGVPSVNNDPQSRWETATAWTDKENNLWLFGGLMGSDLNDLWRYNIATNEWTWVSGSNLPGQHGAYGIKGIPDPANVPGARYVYAKWIDENENLWLFGGDGFNAVSTGELNDLWRYNISTNEWTWMSGTDQLSDAGLSGAMCELSPDNRPSARWETRACWRDHKGNFWLYGGYSNSTELNDLWVYVPDSNAWALVSTSTLTAGFYGTQGVSSSFTHPPSKMGALAWTDSLGDLYLSNGGFIGVASQRNDLWKYVIDADCPFIQLPQINFSSTDTTLCEKFCIDFFDLSQSNPTSWLWQFPGGVPSSSTDQNPANICYDNPGTYDVTLITTSANGSDTLTLPGYITVYPTPPFPTITQAGYTLTSSPASSYQWQLNAYDIPGATNQSYTILQTGLYTVIVSDSNGCVNSATTYVLISGLDDVSSDANISIYPNPATDGLMVEWLNSFAGDEISISILNTLGQEIFSSRQKILSMDWKKEIDLNAAASGVYFLEIKSQNIFLKKKIIITKYP